MSKEKEAKVERPITIRGENRTILSIFVSESKLTLSVSKRAESGFERIDRYTIPMNWLLAELFRRNKGAFSDWCEVLSAIEESE
jgi:DNA-binding NtrC family response regulator